MTSNSDSGTTGNVRRRKTDDGVEKENGRRAKPNKIVGPKPSEQGKQCGCHGDSKPKRPGVRRFCTPRRMHAVVPYLFFFEVFSLGLYGIPNILPVMFPDSAIYHQILGTIMIAEIVANWYFISYTDSSLNSSSFSLDELRFEEKPKSVPQIVKNSKGKAPIEDKHLQHGIYPYWAWSPCLQCQIWRPPRCHHCPLCQKCVLKRDHHCFFTRNCVGFLNQKYYIVFCVWTFFSMSYAFIVILIYYFQNIWSHVTAFDLVPFFSFSRYFTGRDFGISGLVVLMVWVLAAFIVISFLQLGSAMDLLTSGIVGFEKEHNIDVKDDRSITAILESVFGERWYLNFILPLYGGRFSPKDDPYHWQYHTPPRKQANVRVWSVQDTQDTQRI